MKPNDLKPPFPQRNDRCVVIQDRVWYIPDMDHSDENFSFPGWEHPDLFGNSNPVYVEYCSGNGEWIAEKAKQNPHINWVAVEIRFMRTRKIWSKIKNYGLDNLVVICGEGMHATKKYFPDASIHHVYVNFPDPWPKRRHAKHRIIQPYFVSEVERITIPSGELTLVTDDIDYSEQMIETVTANPGFSSILPQPYFSTDQKNYGCSWFEVLWRQKGKLIRFHQFSKEAAV
jgi:tRNA (guanine-N7-)-methyltransferase